MFIEIFTYTFTPKIQVDSGVHLLAQREHANSRQKSPRRTAGPAKTPESAGIEGAVERFWDDAFILCTGSFVSWTDSDTPEVNSISGSIEGPVPQALEPECCFPAIFSVLPCGCTVLCYCEFPQIIPRESLSFICLPKLLILVYLVSFV